MSGDDKKTDAANTEVAPPDWLNSSLIQEALRRGGEENCNVKQLTLKPAIPPGENYMSAIYRANVTLQDGSQRTLIIKTLPPGELGKMAQECDVFRTEIAMFGSILPEIEDLLNAAAPGRYSPLTARGLHHGDNPSDFLVVQDLEPQGFRLANRQKGLGLRHCLVALRALARFHAASVAVLEKNPKALGGLRNMFVQADEHFKSLVVTSMEPVVNACRSWPGFEEYALFMDKLKSHIITKCAELNKPKPGRFNVISHGDFWINNMLFRYENGVPQDVRLVDLQLSRVVSPALDLIYFLSSSVSEDVSIHHEDLLIREYHKALCEALELLQRQAPSLEELLEDIDAHGTFALIGSLCVLPVIKTQKFVDLDAVVSGDDSGTVSLYEDPIVKRWLQRLIPEYKRKGWLPS